MKLLLALAAGLLLSGCATSPFGTATSGGANYAYNKQGDNCTITINSAREISGGVLKINEDCSVEVNADTAGGSQALKVIEGLVGKIK